MKTGEIVLIPFPFAEFNRRKVRPAAVVCERKMDFVISFSVRSVRSFLISRPTTKY